MPMSHPNAEQVAALRPRLMRFALRRMRDRAQAEDAVQDTLVAALENIDRYAGQSSLATWTCGILRHKIADGLRAAGREDPLEADHPLLSLDDPAQDLARSRALEALERNLGRMPAKAGRVFVLRDVLGLESEEVCTQLAISATNFWVTLHRVRRRLREAPDLRGLATDAI